MGASGSYIVTAKLFAPAGAPLHASAGETLLPVHPIPLKTFTLGTVWPSWTSGLLSVKAADPCALAAEKPVTPHVQVFTGLSAGAHTVSVSGVALNCALSPPSPYSVTVSPGAMSELGSGSPA